MTQYEEIEPEEGFLSCRPTLSITHHLHSSHQQLRPLFYQPSVLATYPMHFKLPKELLSVPFTFTNYQNLPPSTSQNIMKEEQGHTASQQPEKLILVYEKFKDYSKGKETSLPANRDVNLDNLLQYQEKDYRLLKQTSLSDLLSPPQRLEFESQFECANLHSAYQHTERANHYSCLIENDTNTNGYNQFFYFAVKGIKKNTPYRFSIVNFTKKFSFFRQGMKPTFFSLKRQMSTGCGWFQHGHNVRYGRSTCSLVQKQKQRLYTLSFQVEFDEDQEFLTISSVLPYSYSRLIHKLKELRSLSIEKDVFFKMQTVAYTVSNNQVPEVIISKEPPSDITNNIKKSANKRSSKSYKHQVREHPKKVIVITARQHPGQTNSSLLMEELLHCLVAEPNEKIAWLLRHYQFRIYPMVNVDGVIYGNSRCDLTGFDLNRTWRHPIKELHPQIYHIKNIVKQIQKCNKVVYCLDLHSHSKMYNVFTYGCKQDEITSRLFSWLLSKNTPLFHLPSCTYGLSFQKRETLRAVMASITLSQNVSTIECSYYGVKDGKQTKVFDQKMFEELANAVLYTLRSLLKKDVRMKNSLSQIKAKLERETSGDRGENATQVSDSEIQNDKSTLQSKLKRMLGSRAFIQKIKKRYQQQEKQLQREDYNYLVSQPIEEQIEELPSNHQYMQSVSLKQREARIQPSSRSQDAGSKTTPQQKSQNKDNPIPKYNINTSNTDLPFLKNFKQTLHRDKKIKLSPNVLYNPQEVITEESPPRSNPYLFDDREFQREMKFLYRELRNGFREVYLRDSKIKEKNEHRNQYRNMKLESLKNLAVNSSICKNRKKTMNIKSLLPNSFRSEENEVLLRIKSEHCEGLSEKEDSFRWKYNLNQSELLDRTVDKEISALSSRKQQKFIGHLPIFHKFFKMKQRSSFRQ